MTLRRSIVALLAAGLLLSAAACSGDDDTDDAGSSTTTEETDETTDPADDITTTTLDDESYMDVIQQAHANLAAAGTDLCLISTAAGDPVAPANPAQVEAFIGLYTATYDAAAGALEADDPTSAAALRAGAAALAAEAEAAEYSTDFLTGDSQPEALSSPEFAAANEALQTKYSADCAPEAPDTGAVAPEETPEG